MTLLELYQLWEQESTLARELLAQTHWFTVHAEFDPRTGEALPQALSAFLAKLANARPSSRIQDRLYRIIEHARPAIERVFRALNESPRREHAVLPLRAVRELDAGSFVKLSTRPGRTMREKLADKPYLYAVRRFQSVDLPENRLLKAFVARLAELLELRQIHLGEQEDELLPKIRSWLLSDQAQAIGRWENPPPNNTLLAHRDYRRVWDSWRRLQTLDEDIDRDLSQIDHRREMVERWTKYAQMYREGRYLFAEMPVLFDYENFTIQTWSQEPVVRNGVKRISRVVTSQEIRDAVCIDLVEVHPRFADTTKASKSLHETYVWQQWKNDTDTVDIALFNSDALYLHPDACTVALPDLLFDHELSPDILDRAARAFSGRLREVFKNDRLLWLFPDCVNDFELEIIRRNLNARFPHAEPLPRSVAAIFEKVDYSRITGDGYPIVVVDTVRGITSATKFLARFNEELKRRVPETNGFLWERCPPVILSQSNTSQARKTGQDYEMFSVDRDGNWDFLSQRKPARLVKPDSLRNDARIRQFAFCLNVPQSPVVGGMRFRALQERAGDIPVWRDHIPELSIKVLKDGCYQSFYLVACGTTVNPIRGLSVRIPVSERFTLPSGKRFYQFPLYQGEDAHQLRFSARLDSPAFPLKKDTDCELILTFRYGEDEPYSLVFVPLDKSFPPVRVTWQRTIEEVVTDAPAPDYPAPMSWQDLRRVPKPRSQETSDLLEWFLSAIERLDKKLPQPRTVGELRDDWREDRQGNYFSFAKCPDADSDVFIHQQHFLNGVDFQQFSEGDWISFELKVNADGSCWAWRIAGPDYKENTQLRDLHDETVQEVCKYIRKSLYFPVISIWKDGRSLTDAECPSDFAEAAKEKISHLSDLVARNYLPQPIKDELLFLLACMHKDTTELCVHWITEQVNKRRIDNPRAVGFALGDLSEKWQQSVFHNLAAHPDRWTIGVFAYAIWRERHFVEHFVYKDLDMLLETLFDCVAELEPRRHNGRNEYIPAWPLELLLGLLRTRASENHEIKMLLQPHQKITKEFAKQIDRIEDLLTRSQATLFSRVQINLKKPEGVRTPDLLYALRLYLTGDAGANAIHITNVSDRDDDSEA